MSALITRAAAIAALIATSLAAPVGAESISLSGTLLNSCTLTLSVPGALAASSDGTVMSSENLGGLPATMALVALGGAPTITFAAPGVNGPAGSTSGAATQIRYTSLQGANQPYTSGISSRTGGALIDTFTIHGRVTNAQGFNAGTYTVTTVATCQQ